LSICVDVYEVPVTFLRTTNVGVDPTSPIFPESLASDFDEDRSSGGPTNRNDT
uniref:C2 domain-containing protein n=1 Tax=Rodentolepis nana TaxID=102285 RepID=A0A0R3TK82_RODNA